MIPRLALVIMCLSLLAASAARAQEPPPPIPKVAFDLHGTVLFFPSSDALAASRHLIRQELPGAGFGGHAALTIYPVKWKAVTFGIGADAAVGRSHKAAGTVAGSNPPAPTREVTERFAHIAPELSFNFGHGNGWSYFSGGLGPSVWSLETPDPAEGPFDANVERLKTINYGGGARWFMKRHLAFSLDVRFYAINPTTPRQALPAGPRTRLFTVGAGISLK